MIGLNDRDESALSELVLLVVKPLDTDTATRDIRGYASLVKTSRTKIPKVLQLKQRLWQRSGPNRYKMPIDI